MDRQFSYQWLASWPNKALKWLWYHFNSFSKVWESQDLTIRHISTLDPCVCGVHAESYYKVVKEKASQPAGIEGLPPSSVDSD